MPLVIFAGKEYGTGSSRDWAAKGTMLMGVKAVIAESFERIHRSNLVGMGVLPLQFKEGQICRIAEARRHRAFDLTGLDGEVRPRQQVIAEVLNGRTVRPRRCRLRFASIHRSRSNITRAAASCNMCSASFWPISIARGSALVNFVSSLCVKAMLITKSAK